MDIKRITTRWRIRWILFFLVEAVTAPTIFLAIFHLIIACVITIIHFQESTGFLTFNGKLFGFIEPSAPLYEEVEPGFDLSVILNIIALLLFTVSPSFVILMFFALDSLDFSEKLKGYRKGSPARNLPILNISLIMYIFLLFAAQRIVAIYLISIILFFDVLVIRPKLRVLK